MIGWQWHQLDHMQIICTSLQTDNHTSTHSVFYRPDAFLPPNQQHQSTEGTMTTKKETKVESSQSEHTEIMNSLKCCKYCLDSCRVLNGTDLVTSISSTLPAWPSHVWSRLPVLASHECTAPASVQVWTTGRSVSQRSLITPAYHTHDQHSRN